MLRSNFPLIGRDVTLSTFDDCVTLPARGLASAAFPIAVTTLSAITCVGLIKSPNTDTESIAVGGGGGGGGGGGVGGSGVGVEVSIIPVIKPPPPPPPPHPAKTMVVIITKVQNTLLMFMMCLQCSLKRWDR